MKNALLFLLTLCFCIFNVQAQTVEFSDGFESGTDNWVLEGSWGLSTAEANSGAHSLTDSPGGNYAANLNISATMANSIDLSTALDATLSFAAIYDIENGNFDYCYVEASPDGGATWINIKTIFGEDNLSPWNTYSYSLGGLVGSNDVKLRFRFFSDGGYEVDGIYIDDIMITSSDVDAAAPLILHTPPEHYESVLADMVLYADIVDISGVASATLNYHVQGVTQDPILGVNTSGDTYEFIVPMQVVGDQIDYIITATDTSPAANAGSTSTHSYLAGNHLFYDNAEVNFVNSFGPAAASGFTACAVRFSFTEPTDIKYALIRNYTDNNRPNDDMEFHIWAADGDYPGDDMITPFMVTPEANLDQNSPMTRIDLRDYSDQLSEIEGDVFMGFSVPEGETWLVQTTPAVGNRTYVYDGASWAMETDDYHFRLITQPTPTSNVAEAQLANAIDLYPNPTKGQLNIAYSFDENRDINLSITNAVGQLVYAQQMDRVQLDLVDLDLSHLSNGVYFLVFNDGTHQYTEKLILNR